jgi:KAP-like P-loop domain-containing protein
LADVDGPNKHILNYLKHYCDQRSDFDYAVLLTGPWGVGKTYLIKKFIESRTIDVGDESKKDRTLYVSLYGITSVRQIEDEFLRQLHPILSSKGMKIAWAVTKKLVKATAKVELGDEEVSIDAQLPDIDLNDYFETPKECLLVFDDLERCSMNVSDVLGYINSFVEHHGFKAIILANEAAILENGDKYKLIKEKLIGQTLEVRSSTLAALPNFLQLIRHPKTREFLKSSTEIVLSLHKQSGTGNLRLLKHALWDFERLSANFSETHWSNKEALLLLLRIVLALSFEVRSGAIKPDQFGGLATSEIVRRMAAKGGDDTSTAGRIIQKYELVQLEDPPLSFEILKALLFEGWVAAGEIKSALDASRFYSDPALEPAWLTAWRGWEIGDDQFELAMSKIEGQFKGRQFQDTEEMLHIFGLRLLFAQIGAIPIGMDQVVTQCIDCLDDLAKADRIEEFDTSKIWRVGGVYCLGHGVTLSETPEFKTIYLAFEKKVAETKAARLPNHGRQLLLQMEKDPIGYAHKIMLNNISPSEFHDVPILATIKPTDFVDKLLALGPQDQSSVFSAFRGRYERVNINNELATEKGWLKSVKAELIKRMPGLRPLSRFRLTNLIGHNIDPFLVDSEGRHKN